MRRISLTLLFTLLLPAIAGAFDVTGIQPVSPNGIFSTFSTYSNPKGSLTLEAGIERAREPDFFRYNLKGAYSLTDSMEVLFAVPYVHGFAEIPDGFEDISLGLKHRFYDEGKYGPSLAYVINASLPTGQGDFSTDGRIGLGFILSKRVGPFKGHANIFYERPGNRSLQDEISFATGIEFSAAHSFSVLGELYAKKAYYAKEYDQLEGRFGYRLKTTDNIYTTLGAGLDLRNSRPQYRFFISIGYNISGKSSMIKKIIED